MTTACGSRRPAARVAASLALAVGIVWTALPGSPAVAEVSYDAFARANALDFVISNASIPTGIDIQGAGPAAEVRQNSFGVGDASAQFPFAGDTVPGVPGTAGSLLGLPVPPYPFIAASTRGSGPQRVSYPGVALSAESGDFSTLSAAVVGADASGAQSRSRVDEGKDGTVTAHAETEAASLLLGNVARLSGVRTVTSVAADGSSGRLTRATSAVIGGISVPGLVLTLPKETPSSLPQVPMPIPGVPPPPPVDLPPVPVPLGGQTFRDPAIGIVDGAFTLTVPFGGESVTVPLPTEPVVEALAAAGIGMTFQEPEETKAGVVSGSYTFTYTIAEPPPNTVFNGPTKVTQTTGLTVASVDLRAVPESEALLLGGVGVALPPDSGPLPAADGTTGGGSLGGDVPFTSGGDASSPAAPALAQAQSPGGGPVTAVPTITFAGLTVDIGIGNIYLALVVIGLVGYATATTLRLTGVRFLWSS